ncbi:hypothetical protein ACJ41O_006524 [Fusarium nematophilum]
MPGYETPHAPELPSNSSQSFWHSEQDEKLKDHQSTGSLPDSADVVIIGSGLTGVLIAHNLLSAGPARSKSVVMLEARSFCSGATGRNGGHIKPDLYRGFSAVAEQFSTLDAVKQCHFEAANHKETVAFIRKQNLAEEISLVEYRSADVFLNRAAWEDAKASYGALEANQGDVSQIRVLDEASARTELRVKDCLGAITFPAASLWPYKLAVALTRRLLDQGLQLHTNTLVTGVNEHQPPHTWLVCTPRGNIKASKVVYATNAYTSALLPELTDYIVPVKGTVVAIKPAKSYHRQPLKTSFAFVGSENYDYLIQRPDRGNHFVLGGGGSCHPLGVPGNIGDRDDAKVTPEIVEYLRAAPGSFFQGWDNGEDDQNQGRANDLMEYSWSGIMGFTPDTFPFIGHVPSKKGQFIAAGFQGHGMARIFLCAMGLAQLLLHEPVDQRIPWFYFDVENRLKKTFSRETIVAALGSKSSTSSSSRRAKL